ncbi:MULTISPECIES: oxidoreductase [unclassified Streptomyces]|uniref:oxidoreductase n=1 Tax=unclassified Streptomyces TaxID=2593676 RepID=UPI000CD5090E|nr:MULTISPECIES: oxidoreductase [unclassified Streptomyces]
MQWTVRDIPDLTGRTAVVTGANSGLGYVTARELARHGARVVLACRDPERGEIALARMDGEVPEARLELRALDLADLASVRAFAEAWGADRLDLLINNAGLMAVPLARTADGFESQFGVNHLGHFALTGLLMDRLLATPGARVVTVSSMLHVFANIDPRDLNAEHGYRRWTAYFRSKTANLLFTQELTTRYAGRDVLAAASHPGYSSTELHARGARLAGSVSRERLMTLASSAVASTPELGAAPTLYAATAREVRPGAFYGPRRLFVRGAPGDSWRAPWTVNDLMAQRLWSESERLTGVVFPA